MVEFIENFNIRNYETKIFLRRFTPYVQPIGNKIPIFCGTTGFKKLKKTINYLVGVQCLVLINLSLVLPENVLGQVLQIILLPIFQMFIWDIKYSYAILIKKINIKITLH